jgi:hypothetical protein
MKILTATIVRARPIMPKEFTPLLINKVRPRTMASVIARDGSIIARILSLGFCGGSEMGIILMGSLSMTESCLELMLYSGKISLNA